MTDVIILAGGKGTRLSSVLKDVPKSMALIAGKPFLEYLIHYLSKQGLFDVILSVGYLKEHIISHFGSGKGEVTIRYSEEEEPLGTGGAIKKALALCRSEYVFVLNGDTLFLADLDKMNSVVSSKQADLVIALREVPNANRYGSVEMDETGSIMKFREKDPVIKPGLINGGIYLLKRSLLDSEGLPEKFSLEQDFFPQVCVRGGAYGQVYHDYFLDIGIPDDYQRAQTEFPNLLK